ncbi:MAG: signal peptidase I [Clostridia bacterium]|nr:signal peptidase I [Clostridia bacterium]
MTLFSKEQLQDEQATNLEVVSEAPSSLNDQMDHTAKQSTESVEIPSETKDATSALEAESLGDGVNDQSECATLPFTEEVHEEGSLSPNADSEEFEEGCPSQDEQETAEKNTAHTHDGGLQFIYDTLELIAISLVAVMVILTVFTRHSPVNGSSMFPTILGRNDASSAETVGEDTLLISNLFYTPKKGDIVVVQTPNIKGTSNVALSLNHPIVKRIIATEGDRVTIDFINWHIKINGEDYEAGFNSTEYVNYVGTLTADGTPTKPMEGFYPSVVEALKNDERCAFTQEGAVFSFTIPQGQVFILGDNRNNSKDSRAIGLIDERWIIGKSIIRIYPFDRIGVVD